MTAIKTKGLTKKYGEKTVVDGICLSVEHGELFSLLGTNGAGKDNYRKNALHLNRAKRWQSRDIRTRHKKTPPEDQGNDKHFTAGNSNCAKSHSQGEP